jgi:hypothetical protein
MHVEMIDDRGLAFELIGLSPDSRSAVFAAEPGRSYIFRVTAIDRAGNSARGQAATTIRACTPDSFEEDDTSTLARLIDLGVPQRHNTCSIGDVDWVYFHASAGVSYMIRALAAGPTSWDIVELVDSDGSTVLLQALPPATSLIGQGAALCWTAPRDSVFFVRVRPQNPRAAGNETAYDLIVSTGYCGFLPGILR